MLTGLSSQDDLSCCNYLWLACKLIAPNPPAAGAARAANVVLMRPDSQSRTEFPCRTDRFGDIGSGPLPASAWAAVYLRLALLGPLRILVSLCGALLMRIACFISQRVPATRPYILAPAAMSIARAMLFSMGFVRIRHTSWRSKPRSNGASGGSGAGASVAGAAGQLSEELRSRDETPIVVCNHVSWLDILLVQCFYAGAFVARIEQRTVPIIGGICDALPCVYVDREKGSDGVPPGGDTGSQTPGGQKSTTDKVVERINAKYADKKAPLRPLCIFAEVCGCQPERLFNALVLHTPSCAVLRTHSANADLCTMASLKAVAHDCMPTQGPRPVKWQILGSKLCLLGLANICATCLQGTTTNGQCLLPFRTGAFVAGKPVQPMLLSYGRHPDGPSLSWETIEFPNHLKLVLSTLLNSVRVVELPVYHPSADEARDAGLYARNVRAYMVRM